MTGIMCAVAAGPGVAQVSISPASQTLSGSTSSKAFAASTITVIGGIPTAYVWSFTDQVNGTWSIQSGQGTSSAVANVSGVLVSGIIATATLTCTVTVDGLVYVLTEPVSYERL